MDWISPALAAAITGILALAASVWARRGQKEIDVSEVAMKMVDDLRHRVQRLEDIDSWRQVVASIDADHISELRQHILDERPPPPPPRPIYPPRPVSA